MGLSYGVAMLFTAAGITMANAAWAAHPLQTEDTGTQGEGNFEWENSVGWTRAGSVRQFVAQPQLSAGLGSTVDLIVQASWLRQSDVDTPTVRGWGDTVADAKWRFAGVEPWSLAIRAGLTLPTAQKGLGLPSGKVSEHAVLVGTWDAAPITLHGNLGLTVNPSDSGLRRRSGLVSAALVFAPSERLSLAFEAGATSNSDPARTAWQRVLMVGGIYTLRPGLDVDVGYQLHPGTSPRTRDWLVGLTWRFGS